MLAVAFLLASQSQAVVVATNYESAGLNDPGMPYWGNVGQMSSASTVYLGGGWAITANHVTPGDFRFSDGRDFAVVQGSEVVLTNPANSGAGGHADLRMFRLAQDPGLPTVPIVSTAPAASAIVMMIGAGLDRDSQLIGWQTNTAPWPQTPLAFAPTRGFDLLSTSHIRWGESRISTSQAINNGTVTFITNFSANGVPLQAQAVSGDSGGGVFELVNGTWQLAGIMTAETLLTNQPSGTVVFGDNSYSASLAVYRNEIMSIIGTPLPTTTQALSSASLSSSVSSDATSTSANSLQAMQSLEGHPASPNAASLAVVPEPSTGVLAALGAAALLAAGWMRRRAVDRPC